MVDGQPRAQPRASGSRSRKEVSTMWQKIAIAAGLVAAFATWFDYVERTNK